MFAAAAQGSALHALTGYEDGSVALWDTRNSSTYLAAQKLHSEPVMCLAAAADCSSGFSGSADDKLSSFEIDLSKGHLKAGPQLLLPQQGLADVAIRLDGRIATTAGWDAKLRVWHCRKRQPLAILRWHSQQVASVAFSRDNALLAAGGRDNFISMWRLYPPL
jgi:WD40 repeat protein